MVRTNKTSSNIFPSMKTRLRRRFKWHIKLLFGGEKNTKKKNKQVVRKKKLYAVMEDEI